MWRRRNVWPRLLSHALDALEAASIPTPALGATCRCYNLRRRKTCVCRRVLSPSSCPHGRLLLMGPPTTATTTSTASDTSFIGRLFSSLLTRIGTWLADAQNGITDFFARRGIFEELCVKDANGQTCLTRSQVDAMLSASAAAGAPTEEDGRGAPASSPASGDEPRVGTTTTPAIEAT